MGKFWLWGMCAVALLGTACDRKFADNITGSSTTSGAVVSGVVLDRNGHVASGATVQLYRYGASTKTVFGNTASGSLGGFSFTGVSDGTYVVIAKNASLGTVAQSSDFTVSALSSTISLGNLALKYPGTVTAKILLSGRSYHDDTKVTLHRGQSSFGPAITNFFGSASVGDLASGTYNVTIRHDGFADYVTTNVLVTANQTTDLGTLTLNVSSSSSSDNSPKGLLVGTVYDGNNSNAALGTVRVVVFGNGLAKETTTSTNGTYALANIPAGAYTVSFSKTGYQTSHVSATVAGDQTAQLNQTMFVQAASISGKALVGNTSQGISGATLALLNTVFSTTSDISGNFAFNGVPVGSYTLRFSADGFATVTKNISVQANQLNNVSISSSPN